MMETYRAYILYSESLQKFYVGFTSDMEKRLWHHNSNQDRFSKKGTPWKLIHAFECESKAAAMLLEKRIKARGAGRFLDDRGIER